MKKIGSLAFLLLFAVVLAVVFPRPLPISAKEGLLASATRFDVEEGEPVIESQQANLPADSEGAAKVEAILQKYRWRPTLQAVGDSIAALWGGSAPSINPGGGMLTIHCVDEESAYLTAAENGTVLLNNRRCRIGRFGKEKGQALYQELLTALEDHLE